MGKWARWGHTAFTNLNFKPFLNTPIRPDIISSGTRSFSTVTETLAGTLGGLKKHLTASIGTVELRILIRGCLQSDTDQYKGQRTAEGTVTLYIEWIWTNYCKLSRNFVGAIRTTTINCRVSFIDLYLVFPRNFRMAFLPHTNTVVLLERYCGTITEPGLPVVKRNPRLSHGGR